jgi:hypothetical protein
MDGIQGSIVERVKSRLSILKHQRARYIELANKPYKESTQAENIELLELERVVDSAISTEAVTRLIEIIEAVGMLSDVGRLFDGADHLNEHTHEANEKHLIAAMDKIHAITNGAAFNWIGGIPVFDDTDDGTIPDHLYERDGKWYPRVPDTDPAAKGQT